MHCRCRVLVLAFAALLFSRISSTAMAQGVLVFTSTNQTSAFGVDIFLDGVYLAYVNVSALQSQTVPLPANMTLGTKTLRVQRRYSNSVTKLAGWVHLLEYVKRRVKL